jgi:hypothetical protein
VRDYLKKSFEAARSRNGAGIAETKITEVKV